MIQSNHFTQRLLLLIARTVQRNTEKIIIRLESTLNSTISSSSKLDVLHYKKTGGPPAHWLAVVQQYAPEFLQHNDHQIPSAISENENAPNNVNNEIHPQLQPQEIDATPSQTNNSDITSHNISVNTVESSTTQPQKSRHHGSSTKDNLKPGDHDEQNQDKANSSSIFSTPTASVDSSVLTPQFRFAHNPDTTTQVDKAKRKNNLQRLSKKLKTSNNTPLFTINKVKPSSVDERADASTKLISKKHNTNPIVTKPTTDNSSNHKLNLTSRIQHLKLFTESNDKKNSSSSKLPLFNHHSNHKKTDISAAQPFNSDTTVYAKKTKSIPQQQQPLNSNHPIEQATKNTNISHSQQWPSLDEETFLNDRWPELPDSNISVNNSNIIDSNRIARRTKEHKGSLWSE